jgi:NitT/TauT family transport system substrate-binding protein
MKRVLVVLLMVMALSSVMAGAKKEAAEDDYVFKIGFSLSGSLCGAPLYIALDQGLYAEEGLKFDTNYYSYDNSLAQITNGNLDGLVTLMVGLVQPLANGLPVQIPLALHTGCIKILVRGDDPSIKTVADLKGKKLGGGSPSASPFLFAKRYLTDKGFKVDGEKPDLELIFQNASELPLLLERGIVDAIAINDPTAQIAQDERGFRALVDMGTDEKYKDEFCCVVLVRTDVIKTHPEATAKFLRTIQKAARFVQENPDETAQILADKKYVAGDPLVNARILKTYNYRASVSQVLPALERNARDMQALGLLKADVDVDALIRDVYVEVPGVPDSLFQ